MINPFSKFRFQTRLALVMLLIMGLTSAFLTVTYVNNTNRIMAYLTATTSDLLAISQLAQKRIPPDATRDQAIAEYEKALDDSGLAYTLTSPNGQVLKSTTNPTLVGKKYKIKRRPSPAKQEPIRFSAQLENIDAAASVNADQAPYPVEFPIIQGDKVIGYAEVQVRGVGDQVNALLWQHYRDRLELILATMFMGVIAVVYLASRFTKPINALVESAKQVAQGNLYASLPTAGADEMGRLAQTFNQMVERLRENRQLQDRLNEAEKLSLLGRFAATVAHEVRNSLNFINLSIDQIRAKYSGGNERAASDFQRNLKNIKEEIARQNRLVNDFLAAGRQAPPALAPCDLRQTLDQAIALVDKQAHSQDITLRVDMPAEMPTLQADAAQMKTCFLNILTNAIQAMPTGGQIRVSATPVLDQGQMGSLQMRFADTGPGIPAENRERIFNQFFSTKPTGFGLGLAITKKIVEDHGGRIHAGESNASGTVIVVELPLSPPSFPEPTHATTAAA
ncbi:MAG TPA: HAMP domain-containing sensor histidine kinase [Terriglobia bacterium]|nr:HAMP domain-containing sensor histidine kinase [Terriglobia bacterium]